MAAAGSLALLGTVRPDAGSTRVEGGLLIRGGIVVGFEREAREAAAAGAEVLAMHAGWIAQPAFRDPHLHLLGAAAARIAVDCRAERLPDLESVLGALGEAAAATRPGAWVRGSGFDEALLAERRTPCAADLDRAVPDHPLALRHRTGHGTLLNSRAATLLERTDGRSRVAGVLVPPESLPPLSPTELAAAVGALSRDLAANGIVAVGDATEENDLGRLMLLAGLLDSGDLLQDLVFMPGAAAVAELAAQGLEFGDRYRDVTLGHAKIVPRAATPTWLRDGVAAARARRWPLAVHAIGPVELESALGELGRGRGGPAPDRIEHASLCLPEQHEQVVRAGVAVVSNPAFLVRRGRKYERELTTVEHGWLFPVAALRERGVLVAAASDAPVVAPRPGDSIRGAVLRGDGGRVFAADQAVDIASALRMTTGDAGLAMSSTEGLLRRGEAADLVVLAADPLRAETGSDPKVVATIRAGRLIHRAGARSVAAVGAQQ
jgi:predicted amidohydrolase YtcJ